jgi:hypothetical protein
MIKLNDGTRARPSIPRFEHSTIYRTCPTTTFPFPFAFPSLSCWDYRCVELLPKVELVRSEWVARRTTRRAWYRNSGDQADRRTVWEARVVGPLRPRGDLSVVYRSEVSSQLKHRAC